MPRLQAALARHPELGPGALELEVLETSALESIAQVTRIVEACAAIGVSFALDDFGTGYSSLAYLKRLPAARLKIDQLFVRGMVDDAEDLAILEAIMGLAHAFRREVIAEGVEDGRAWQPAAAARLRGGAGLRDRAADAGGADSGLGGELVAARGVAACAGLSLARAPPPPRRRGRGRFRKRLRRRRPGSCRSSPAIPSGRCCARWCRWRRPRPSPACPAR